jgi:hypothetical protein
MNKILEKIILITLKILTYLLIILWGLVTIIVIIFLIHRLLNPHWKSISNQDLIDYGLITLVFICVYFLILWIKILMKRK